MADLKLAPDNRENRETVGLDNVVFLNRFLEDMF